MQKLNSLIKFNLIEFILLKLFVFTLSSTETDAEVALGKWSMKVVFNDGIGDVRLIVVLGSVTLVNRFMESLVCLVIPSVEELEVEEAVRVDVVIACDVVLVVVIVVGDSVVTLISVVLWLVCKFVVIKSVEDTSTVVSVEDNVVSVSSSFVAVEFSKSSTIVVDSTVVVLKADWDVLLVELVAIEEDDWDELLLNKLSNATPAIKQ